MLNYWIMYPDYEANEREPK